MTLEISFDDLKEEPWLVKNEHSYAQGDGVSCGPIACLKLMQIYGFFKVVSIETIGESARGYWNVVMDYYNDCVSRFDNFLKVEVHIKKIIYGKQPQCGEETLEAHTVDAHEAAMLAIPSPTSRVSLLGQWNCDWVIQCCVRKVDTPDHCTFGLDSSSRRQCTRPVHFECQLAWETYAKLSHEKRCSSKVVGNITTLNTNTGGKCTG